jgi:hypothetical protein
MVQEVEISALDLRYASYRMRNRAQEQRLLGSIAERGIETPLEGVDGSSGVVLLNGFKRLRCARKLHISAVPYVSLGENETVGIMGLLRISTDKSLSILEQARFIVELQSVHGLNAAQIAQELGRSKSWVSMRLGLMREMSEAVRDKLFSGAFPVYAYMYTMRQFMRMNSASKGEVESFVLAVSGKHLSVREVEQLAQGYFRGPESFREEILKGNVHLPLKRLRQVPEDSSGCSKYERVMLGDLEILQKYMQRVMGKCGDQRLVKRTFWVQANLLSAGILSRTTAFKQTMREFYDRSTKAQDDLLVAPGGSRIEEDCASDEREPEHGAGYHHPTGQDATDGAAGQNQN